MARANIVTNHAFPPIPARHFDWYAYYDGEEERGEYGWGRTEQEAISDLLDNWPEDTDTGNQAPSENVYSAGGD